MSQSQSAPQGRTTHIHNGPLVIGAGLAGLSVALNTAPHKTLVLAPVSLGEACSSAWAQGGIAAALSHSDSPQSHAADTVAAGAGIVDEKAAQLLAQLGPQTVRYLNDLGAPFDHNKDGSFMLNREAAHSIARVARVGGDLAGKAILEAVVHAAKSSEHIEIWEPAFALSLITAREGRVIGALVRHGEQLIEVYAPVTILATGGVGGLYAVTTNPSGLKGEGIAIAALAGAVIADAEFVQFHPTALNIGGDPAPLATEALRGEGATLVTRQGHRFVFDDHKDGELAPRDIVARAVHRANLTLGGAFLDATKAIGPAFPDHFPTVFASCQKAGIDPRTQLMPVAPAAHYHMGGVATDLDGQSSLQGLMAVGECASTGIHGANRLASNSLLEAAAFGARLGKFCTQNIQPLDEADLKDAHIPAPSPVLEVHDLRQLRQAMTHYAAVERSDEGLTKLLALISELETKHGQALALITARMIATAALLRRESRGSHFRSDFPKTRSDGARSFLKLKDILAMSQSVPA